MSRRRACGAGNDPTRHDADSDAEVANRRVFYDFTLSPPKSVSVAALVGGDERIVVAHREAVRAAAAEFDQFATAQVHAGRKVSMRPTGNITAALFQHETSRALDPHLHTHCIIFNATHDPAEQRWKALQNYGLLTAQKYLENIYYHALAQALRRFGYTVFNNARGDFEIAEVSPAVRELFSKRHREIDAKTRELLALTPDKRGGNVAAIVDEAGQIGGRQLLALLQLVQRSGGRVILSGDTRQHGPVEVSDALRAIERYSALRPAELNEIRRQDPARAPNEAERARIASYRDAVSAAADGDCVRSFQTLEALGAIEECGTTEQATKLAETFLFLARRNESALVVSQTRAEVRVVNEVIRTALIDRGALGQVEHTITALEAVDLTAAQKADARYYPPDAVAVLNRESRGLPRGSTARVIAVTTAGVAVEAGGKVRLIARRALDRLTICQPRELKLREGDRLQLKANAATIDGRKLANGEIVTVTEVGADGSIRLADGRLMPPHFRQFTRGYAVTSYGSQGKTVDHVLFADSSVRAATNAEQWYVTISRGRKSVRIFTSDKAQLAANIRRAGHRELALDLNIPPQRSRRVREHVLLGLKRGREFARRVCTMLSRRAWLPTKRQQQAIKPTL